MTIALLSDIHSNSAALKTCLDYARSRGADSYILLGDYVSECAYPERTMDMLYELRREFPCEFIRGNREEYMLANRARPEGWAYNSGTGSLLYTYERLRPEDFAFFEMLEATKTVGDFFLCHGTPLKSRGSLAADKEETPSLLAGVGAPIILCGHTHQQYQYRKWGKHVINPGSVGMAAEGKGFLTCMALLHETVEGWDAELIRLPYDGRQSIREILESGLAEKGHVWAAMTAHMICTGRLATYHVPYLAAELFEKRVGSDRFRWREVPESFWGEAARQMGIELDLTKLL